MVCLKCSIIRYNLVGLLDTGLPLPLNKPVMSSNQKFAICLNPLQQIGRVCLD